MSDGITEARRGTYFSGGYEVKNIKHTPDPKWHKIISFIKSGIRIVGYCLIPFNLVIATVVLIFSELIGIIEELV
jgi:hypothetical protein